jgi:Cu/Ag efflux protein CusF
MFLALPVFAQSGGAVVGLAPGAVGAAQTVSATATITKIDKGSRTVTLKSDKGQEVTVIAGPEVKNFGQLKVGDSVDIEYTEAVAFELKKGGGKPVARTEEEVTRSAKPGDNPAGVQARKVTVVGDVTNVDPATQTVTVRGPKRTVDLKVRDPEQFKLIAKGDQIQATYVEAVAASVKPKAKK